MDLPTLDAHAHLDPVLSPDRLRDCGAVLAMTVSLEEAEQAADRQDLNIAWGVGCHPRFPRAQENFDARRFRALTERMALVGEVGLDSGSRVPLESQLKIFRQVLKTVADRPRLVSIHSVKAAGLVLAELKRCPIEVPVLHWWTGNVDETREAVELGCYFSSHSAIARKSKFRLHVPEERLLLESDHGYRDPPEAIPCRIEWVEYLTAQQYDKDVLDIRRLAWRNLGSILRSTGTMHLFPDLLRSYCS